MTWNDVNALVLRLLARWWIVAIAILLGVGFAVWTTSSTADSYRTTTLLLISANRELEPSEQLRATDLLSNDMVMGTYADVLASPRVVREAMAAVSASADDWDGYEVRVVGEPDSNVLRMTVEGPNADAVEQLTTSVLVTGQQILGQAYAVFEIEPLSTGEPVAELVSLPWARTLVLGAVGGFAIGALVAVWVDSLIRYRRSAAAGVAGTAAGDRGNVASAVAPFQRQ